MPSPIQISYRRSGGLAGLELTAHTVAADLPNDQADVASALLSGHAESANHPTGPGVPDGFTYELHVHDAGRQRTFRWTDGDVPDTVRPLLDSLNRRAAPTPSV